MTSRATRAGLGSIVAAAVGVATFLIDGGGGDAGDAGSSSAVATPLEGAALFQAKGCATCHTGPDSPGEMSGFPSLRDAPSWAGDRQYGLTAWEYLEQSIRDPVAVISPEWRGSVGPTSAMPTLAVSEDEIDALVDYLLGEQKD